MSASETERLTGRESPHSARSVSAERSTPPSLVALLDLADDGADRFIGPTQPVPSRRLFGGLLLAQSIRAAGRTVEPERPVHSMHAMFVRPGDPAVPLEHAVDRVRDGGTTSARRVIVRQRGREIFSALVSFQRGRGGVEHQPERPHAPAPEELAPLHERMAVRADAGQSVPRWWRQPRAVELRHVDDPPYLDSRAEAGPAEHHRVWLRVPERLPREDPVLHACALAYASDMTVLEPAFLRHDLHRHEEGVRLASLDHAMWFHRPVSADEFVLLDQRCPTGAAGRILGDGRMFDRAGRHVVTLAQEGLLRVPGS